MYLCILGIFWGFLSKLSMKSENTSANGNHHFLTISCHLPNSWRKPAKIGPIFRKWGMYSKKLSFQKSSCNSFQKSERSHWFLAQKNDFKIRMLWSFWEFLIITGSYGGKNLWLPLDVYVVLCPTHTKILESYYI